MERVIARMAAEEDEERGVVLDRAAGDRCGKLHYDLDDLHAACKKAPRKKKDYRRN